MERKNMGITYNIYCDESCHLEHDHINVMALGAVWCETDKVSQLASALRSLKKEFGLPPDFEIKWTKVSPAKVDFYRAVIDFFFRQEALGFRGVLIPDKRQLDHGVFEQTHDTWYYKMWFVLLKQILNPDARHRIYLDIKDTRSQEKVLTLQKVLRKELYDFDAAIIERVQQVRSHEVELLQIADLFAGALTYLHRGIRTSDAKQRLIQEIQTESGFDLLRSTLPKEEKFNLLIWRPQEW